ncbi:PAS domain-containing protein [Mesorhizobium atlanticum]
MRRSDGAYRWFLLRCAPLLDESGTVVRWYGTNTDIEERKRVEQALSASENLSRGHGRGTQEHARRAGDGASRRQVGGTRAAHHHRAIRCA